MASGNERYEILGETKNPLLPVQPRDCDTETLLLDGLPTIFSTQLPAYTVAYFNGPPLPEFYSRAFQDYQLSISYPLQILEDSKRREQLLEGILSLQPTKQQSLFASQHEELDVHFDALLSYVQLGKPLYKQWKQQIGMKVRELSSPQQALDTLLRTYIKDLILQAPVHKSAHGGEVGWSVEKSLRTHLPLGTVLSFDMSNAFLQISAQYVFDFFYGFTKEHVSEDVARDISGFLTHINTVYYADQQTHALPQGSPTGMVIFNRLLYPLDKLIYEGAQKRGLRYSRWVDDFIVSAPEETRNFEKLVGGLAAVRNEFQIHLKKVFFQQNQDEYYLLGSTIRKNQIKQIRTEPELEPVDPCMYASQIENMNWDINFGPDDVVDYSSEDNSPF